MIPTFYTSIGGTWDWDDNTKVRWYKSNSEFSLFMSLHGFHQLFPNTPFKWSMEIDGIPLPSRTKHSNWRAGAKALIYYLQLTEIPLHKRNIICHSHGLNVVLYACGQEGLKLNNLISVASPIRNDMCEIADIAQDNIENWLHIRDARTDWRGTLGQIWDGKWSLDRTNKWADDEDIVREISHSKIIRDKTCFHLWIDRRWLNFLAFGNKKGE